MTVPGQEFTMLRERSIGDRRRPRRGAPQVVPRSSTSWSTLLYMAIATTLPLSTFASSHSVHRCSLSTNVLTLLYNATSDGYNAPGDGNSTGVLNYVYRRLHVENDDERSSTDEVDQTIQVRTCWCTVYFDDRPVEYCPARFDSCWVEGKTGPVTCYETGGGYTFVKTFWPISIFWTIGLVYGLFCSEPGESARDFMRRKCCRSCFSYGASDDELLHSDVERVLTQQPERAAFLYFSAFTRERHRVQQRQVVNGNASRGGIDLTVENPDHCNVLALKTKPYVPSSVGGDAESISDSVSRASSWLPSQCHREHVTFDDIDSQIEQGVRCAICLVRLNRGESVGDIVCGHLFHKDCLKTWLQRKNRCPLCQQAEIATYGYKANLKNTEQAIAQDEGV